jgi:hypothetical protein
MLGDVLMLAALAMACAPVSASVRRCLVTSLVVVTQLVTRLQTITPSSPLPGSGGDHATGEQEQLYNEYRVVFQARMIAFGHYAQLEHRAERTDWDCPPPLRFTCPEVNRRSDASADGHADHRRDQSLVVHECLLADQGSDNYGAEGGGPK